MSVTLSSWSRTVSWQSPRKDVDVVAKRERRTHDGLQVLDGGASVPILLHQQSKDEVNGSLAETKQIADEITAWHRDRER